MITQEQIDNLKNGDKLIFIRHGGVLCTNKGNVFTFANWYKEPKEGKRWWQCQEQHNIGNHEHNYSIYDTELFDESIHKEFVLMDEEKIETKRREFIEMYGA